MTRLFDHIDLRVRSLEECAPFYRGVLPELGFTERVQIEGWLQFEGPGPEAREFFGVTQDAHDAPNAVRIAFWAQSVSEVDRFAEVVRRLGGCAIEGPGYEAENYYAVYFDDPSGNHLEICHRRKRFHKGGSCGDRPDFPG